MKVSDFDYALPDKLIAQYPPENRAESRLLHVDKDGQCHDRAITDIVDFFKSGDCLVLNDTKVIPARLFGRKDTGGRVEILLERVVNERQFLAQIRASKAPKQGQQLLVDGDDSVRLTMCARQNAFFLLEIDQQVDLFDWFEQLGHMPLPPYIEREDESADMTRYQTVFAKHRGAVAAPTAGLHYNNDLLEKIAAKGVQIVKVTLHVGAGTYQPVRVKEVSEHKMHSEWVNVSQQACQQILASKQQGGRICAVGTTVVRSLESAAQHNNGELAAYSGETDIFITPGFEFKVVDVLQTNFHLPQSTLLMLVSAFAGQQTIMQAYQHAIQQEYHFFSYGDAMLLERNLERK